MTYLNSLRSKIIEIIINILLPKGEKVKQLEILGPNGLFENIPRAENFDFETNKIKAIFNYKNTLCRQAIWEIKYRANKKLIRDFSLLLYEYILEDLSDLNTFDNFWNPILIPIPSSLTRKKEKGFNQCELIARELIKIDKERNTNNFTLLENFLIKRVDTPHQTKVSNRKKRLENLKDTFSINSNQGLALNLQKDSTLVSHSYIIIDDVITTGATMNEAFRALKSIGVNINKVRGYALAH